MFDFIEKIFTGLLTSTVNAYKQIKCLSLSYQKCTTQHTLINLHPNGCTQGLCYYPFMVNLDRCIRSCNILNDLSNKICVSNETEDLNVSVLNKITGITESKTLAKHISDECKSKFDGSKCNSNQKWNNYNCRIESKNPKGHHVCKKDYIWSPATSSCKNDKYLAGIIHDSVITCNKIKETTKRKKVT